jgi:ubiquinol-cytochrome c reductase cytochrome b subunit
MSKQQAVLDWIDARFPLTSTWKAHVSEYYAPKNFNFWYFFGSLAMLVLVIQIVTGIFLTMNYKPDGTLNASGVPVAFASVEYIMRDVAGGWIIRYMHSTGASMFFVVVYLHMFRGLIYGSYKQPRELVWIFGCLIFLCLMAEAFMGYLLPWGQMSYWGAQVIINLEMQDNKKDIVLSIFLPKLVDRLFYHLNGSIYYPILQLVDRGTYVTRKTFTLKTLLMHFPS